MKKQILGLALAAAWMGSNTAWAQVPATPAVPAALTAPVAVPEVPTTPAAPRRANQVQGRVTAVDMVKKTITVTPRRSETSTVLTLAPDAKVLLTQPATMADIKSGSIVAAYSSDLTPGATTVSATRLVILPADAKTGKPGPNAGYHRTYVQGTVANTTPSLTMTTPGGVTVTVTTVADTPVTKTATGTTADITVGANIQARTTGDEASPTATEVRIMPATAGRRGRRQRQTLPDAAVAPAAPAPAAAP